MKIGRTSPHPLLQPGTPSSPENTFSSWLKNLGWGFATIIKRRGSTNALSRPEIGSWRTSRGRSNGHPRRKFSRIAQWRGGLPGEEARLYPARIHRGGGRHTATPINQRHRRALRELPARRAPGG